MTFHQIIKYIYLFLLPEIIKHFKKKIYWSTIQWIYCTRETLESLSKYSGV